MTHKLPILPFGATLTLALLVSACGKQEAISEVPSSEELAQQADAASKAIRDAEAGAGDGENASINLANMESYTNTLRGFTILVPSDWTVDQSASDDNGRVYTEAANGTKLAVSWVENREDAAWSKAVEAIEDGSDEMEGTAVSANEYRASGISTSGLKSNQRLLRKPDGTMVQAEISYDTNQAQSTDPLASAILDSLTLQ